MFKNMIVIRYVILRMSYNHSNLYEIITIFQFLKIISCLNFVLNFSRFILSVDIYFVDHFIIISNISRILIRRLIFVLPLAIIYVHVYSVININD